MRDASGRSFILPQRRGPRSPDDRSLLREAGAEVDVLVAVHGAFERWRGTITRPATIAQPSIARRPFGASTTEIEFLETQVRECAPFESTASMRATIEQIQALRCGRRGTR